MAPLIRALTVERLSNDVLSTANQRVCFPDPCNSFPGSANALPWLKYSLTPSGSARIPRTPSYPRGLGEKLMTRKSRYS